MKKYFINPKSALLIAFLLALPIGLIFSSIEFDIQWLETILKSFLTNDGDRPNTFGFIFMVLGMAALPVSLVVSLIPVFRKGPDGKRHLHFAHLILAAAIVVLIFLIFGGLLKDIYHCDILKIPNCD